MILEYVRYQLTERSTQQLLDAYAKAAKQLDAAPECLGYEMAVCADDPDALILRINWNSAEGHMTGFRKGPHFPPFLAEIRPFIGEIAEMRHYELTPIGSA